MRPISARKSTILCVLDIGSSKIVCLIARLAPMEASDMLRGRTHRCRILGIGHQRSRGIKGGAVVDMDEAEKAIRLAVDAAERMAGVEVSSVVVNATGGRLSSQHYTAKIGIGGKAVSDYDVGRVLEAASATTARQGRAVLHSLPTGFSLDRTRGIRDPKGMIGDELGADMHVLGCDAAAVRNLMLAIERCHLSIEAIVATPYAGGLSALVDDEAEIGATLIDMGGGTTSTGVFEGGNLTHVDAFAVGGNHVTLDIARGLTTRMSDAERLKTLHGTAIAATSDDREIISVTQVGDDADHSNHVPKSQLVRIVRPRIEEILELVRDRLQSAGYAMQGRRVILTGGASQLTGVAEVARRIISPHVRIGRPLGIQGLPESAKNPAFTAAVGLLIYPQFAGVEHFEPRGAVVQQATGTDGYMGRVGRWLKDNF
ncbi:cell division protein FtsA [Lichenifustis flavocetrariae]|uniref:Cell division protein FtsA n=1 Tax=Lichenifustis flavocetrariae TaxID=2949735 RepID=A0AA41Z8A0_9HYPH|nr:cell division protein FtsA [Lichenifustis flavocetrariae]MCW6511112.1 cell division protein FtsA [Lichenifustis flavocetrariae]